MDDREALEAIKKRLTCENRRHTCKRVPFVCLDCPDYVSYGTLLSAMDVVYEALRAQQEAEKNEPLTLDELRQMDGKPVWIVEAPDRGHWELSENAEEYLDDRDTDFYGMKYDAPCGRYGLHKLGWLAYRRPPDGEVPT